MEQKINQEYLSLYREILLLFNIKLIKKNKPLKRTYRVLIINPCLVGDFVASIPALSQFIKTKEFKVDIVVSPQLKPVAKKIKGIDKVYTAKSIHLERPSEEIQKKQKFGEYDLVVVMRTSKEANNIVKNIKFHKIETSFNSIIKYALHILKINIKNHYPKEWKEINFEILNQPYKKTKFEEIFDIEKNDYKKIKKISELKTKNKIILIHTGPAWTMKKWNNSKWAELIKRINSFGKFRFIFIGIKEATKDFEEISKKLNFKIYSLIDKINLLELLLIMRNSDYFIGIDSGPRNMAHLADLRSITLLGPSGRLYMPSNKKDIIIDKTNKWNLYETFFYKTNKFVNKIDPEEVVKNFKKLLKRHNPKI